MLQFVDSPPTFKLLRINVRIPHTSVSVKFLRVLVGWCLCGVTFVYNKSLQVSPIKPARPSRPIVSSWTSNAAHYRSPAVLDAIKPLTADESVNVYKKAVLSQRELRDAAVNLQGFCVPDPPLFHPNFGGVFLALDRRCWG